MTETIAPTALPAQRKEVDGVSSQLLGLCAVIRNTASSMDQRPTKPKAASGAPLARSRAARKSRPARRSSHGRPSLRQPERCVRARIHRGSTREIFSRSSPWLPARARGHGHAPRRAGDGGLAACSACSACSARSGALRPTVPACRSQRDLMSRTLRQTGTNGRSVASVAPRCARVAQGSAQSSTGRRREMTEEAHDRFRSTMHRSLLRWRPVLTGCVRCVRWRSLAPEPLQQGSLFPLGTADAQGVTRTQINVSKAIVMLDVLT